MNKIVLSTLLIANLTVCIKTNKSHIPEQPFGIQCDHNALQKFAAKKRALRVYKMHCFVNDMNEVIFIDNGYKQFAIEQDGIKKIFVTKNSTVKKGPLTKKLGKLAHRNNKIMIATIKASQIFD